jgi:hypothetical protein
MSISRIFANPESKGYEVSICCFSTKHSALRSKNRDWLIWNQDIVSEYGDMTCIPIDSCYCELAL